MRTATRKQPSQRMIFLVCIFAFLPIFPNSAPAELLYFKKGGQVQAAAKIEGDQVIVERPEKRLSFRKEDFRKIVSGEWPAREWEERLTQTGTREFSARYDSAWWAIENGLGLRAAEEIKALHQIDPSHGPTARMASVLERLDHDCVDPSLSRFQGALGSPTRIASGPHLVLLHQHSEEEAEERVAFLENVIASFYLDLAALGIELPVPRQRMIVAWFAAKENYLEFLRGQNAEAFLNTRGYYHPIWKAVASYDARDDERHRSEVEAAQRRLDEIKAFEETLERLPKRARFRVNLSGEPARSLDREGGRNLANRLSRDVTRQRLLVDLESRALDEGVAAHEMVHLLVAQSGLLNRDDAFPIWLQEGFAMQYEVVRGGQWAGISRAHDLRLPDWRKIQPPPRLEPLLRDAGFGKGYQRDAYAQAWALVFFLRSRHHDGFVTYLDLLRGPDSSLADLTPADRFVAAFRRAFGDDLASLETAWHLFLTAAQTPLEANAPE